MLSPIASSLGASLFLGALFLSPGTEDKFSWPQWDGPERNNLSREKNWVSEGKADNLWEAELGLGYSTMTVQDGRLYTMGYDREAGLDHVFCFDAVSGEELWTHSYLSEIWNRAHEGGTVNTPSIDGEVIYTMNREGNLYCLKGESGDIVWHTNLMEDDNIHELEYPTWGFSASPLIVGEEMFLNCGRMLSIDKSSGEVLWRSKQYGHAYGTPVAFELEGEPVLAVLNGNGVAIVSQGDGEEVLFHEFGGRNRGVNAATPIVIDDAIFVSSGTLPAGALLAFGDGELIPVWENREMVNSFSGCVRIGDHLYGFDQRVLKCIDLDGQKAWQDRDIGGNGAVFGTDDRLIVMGGEGQLVVAKANPEKYEVLSSVKLFDEGNYWTKPILVNGIIYCRSSKGKLVARDHRPRS